MSTRRRSSRRPAPAAELTTEATATAAGNTPASLVLIWVIDDGPSNLQRVERTFNRIAAPEVVLESWMDGLKAAGVFERRLEIADRAGIPQIVFMDYFLGGDLTGFDITQRMLAAFQKRPRKLQRVARPIIIGHSSVPDCSAHIVSLSKDFALEKRGGSEVSPAILEVFGTAHKRAHILTHRKPLGW